MAMDAFDLAERFQTPVFVMSDLDLGMNMWMSESFAYPDKPPDRGKVLDDETSEADRRRRSVRGCRWRRHPVSNDPWERDVSLLLPWLGS